MLNVKFVLDDANVFVHKINDDTIVDRLPPKVYELKFSEFMGFYLGIVKDLLETPKKIYGKTPSRVERCIQSYRERSASTGILMTGDKGTGKTLLMSLLANSAITELGLPVILIKAAYSGPAFTSFIESLGETCLVFDEFGKMYTSRNKSDDDETEPQTALLGLLDGVDKTKRLIIMTENNELDINEFLLNRPSRIFYHFRYSKLDEDSITGYCSDRNVKNDATNSILELARGSRIFSFDMLQSIVEEHLRFGASVDEAIEDLNIDIRQEAAELLQVVKVLDKIRGVERELATPFTQKEQNGYGNVYIKLTKLQQHEKSEEPDSPVVASLRDVAIIASRNTQDDGVEIIKVDDDEIVYESKDRIVYETNRFTVVVEKMASTRMNYQDYM